MTTTEIISSFVAIVSLLWGVYTWYNTSKKERLNEKILSVTGGSARSIREVEGDVLKGGAATDELTKRVRKLESIQITEQRVQTMLKERVEPIENAVSKLEDKIERNHRELSTELQISTRETVAQLSKLTETVSFMHGSMESRRKNDHNQS